MQILTDSIDIEWKNAGHLAPLKKDRLLLALKVKGIMQPTEFGLQFGQGDGLQTYGFMDAFGNI